MSAGPRPDPAFSAMAFDMVGNVLGRADNPGELSRYLAEEIRELTGAQCVILLQCPAPGEAAPHRLLDVNPARRRAWAESAAAHRIYGLAHEVRRPCLWRAEAGGEPERLLAGSGFALSLVVPLQVGPFRVGALLVLGDPDEAHAEQVLELLGTLSTVVALVLRSGFLYERQEQVIAERTRALTEANQALREHRDRFELALSGTHFVWDWDLEARRLTISEEWVRARGGTEHAFAGAPRVLLSAIVHPDDLPDTLARIEPLARGEVPELEAEFRSTFPDGELRWILVRGRTSRRAPDGRALRATGVFTDVTRRREQQAQLERTERMASLGTLAAGVAHEINNPLAYVTGNLEFVAGRLRAGAAVTSDVLAAIDEAREGSSRVREVVRSLKAFSAPATGRRAPVDVAGELQAALRLARNEIKHRARLTVELGPMPPVECGQHELGQAFLNLLVNAAQAMPEGRAGENEIRVSAGTDALGRARVTIRDTGVGIPAALLPRIFQPFFTTKPQGVGTGLGLAICHGIVQAAGGTIEVQSAVGVGSTFHVVLPPAPPAAGAEPREPAPPPPSRARVLVVDDEPLVARVASRLLSPAHEVTVAHSGTQALARVEGGERFDVVLCDLMMPDVSGMELYERLGRCAPELRERLVFITGGAFTATARDFLASVGNRCLEKPFDAEAIRAAVAEVIRKGGARSG
ncbi:hybrid sensor histidine kinase/response regulator [Anaeromyxobacter paludicola]|uniref:histidine kinase n=1 Tax=Anaeromyxobacter paludicola TaxID=2918171 RepID=A0ABM7XAE3_9BACT|nr:ATP-binding protein [Anaeromyxobacter paludicola]BDG08828.1 hypothetical protein AMPC_19410 [Anaeromyxobacter paludicola]